MKDLLILLILSLHAWSASAAEYPNELDGYKLFDKYCSGLKPLKSSVSDVKNVMGDAKLGFDGVLSYERDGWRILVYLSADDGEYPLHLAAKVIESIDFIPNDPISFTAVRFPKAFNKVAVRGADARWDEYYDAFGLAYNVYTSQQPYGDKGPGDLARVCYGPAPHRVIQMKSNLIREMKEATGSTSSSAAPSFDTYSGYFVSNKFEPDAAQSFVVLTDQKQFDAVFNAGFVIDERSHRLPSNAFKSDIILAVIKRGSAVWEFSVESMSVKDGVVELGYTTTSKENGSARFASPLIVSIPKGRYRTVHFAENRKLVKKLEVTQTVNEPAIRSEGSP